MSHIKSLIIVILIVLFSIPAFANEKLIKEYCRQQAVLSAFIMSNRQNNLPKFNMVEMISEIFTDETEIKLGEILIDEAYSIPIGPTEQIRDELIEIFAVDNYRECYNAVTSY
jgi:hypothetical protein